MPNLAEKLGFGNKDHRSRRPTSSGQGQVVEGEVISSSSPDEPNLVITTRRPSLDNIGLVNTAIGGVHSARVVLGPEGREIQRQIILEKLEHALSILQNKGDMDHMSHLNNLLNTAARAMEYPTTYALLKENTPKDESGKPIELDMAGKVQLIKDIIAPAISNIIAMPRITSENADLQVALALENNKKEVGVKESEVKGEIGKAKEQARSTVKIARIQANGEIAEAEGGIKDQIEKQTRTKVVKAKGKGNIIMAIPHGFIEGVAAILPAPLKSIADTLVEFGQKQPVAAICTNVGLVGGVVFSYFYAQSMLEAALFTGLGGVGGGLLLGATAHGVYKYYKDGESS